VPKRGTFSLRLNIDSSECLGLADGSANPAP
jgi:hypothetical protein